MTGSVQSFYDELASSYHLLFADWRASVRRQGLVLDGLIRRSLGSGPHSVLDATCGIGTQALGLALCGNRVHATDFSPVAVERLAREASSFGVALVTGVADLRSLASQVAGEFDVVLACDNALPHLLTDEDLDLAVGNMSFKLRPGGLFVASIRNYDRLVRERPTSEGPRVIDGVEGRRIAFQVWDWSSEGRFYELHQFLVRPDGDGWTTHHVSAPYRALLRAELTAAVERANLRDAHWRQPEECGYFQPLLTARKP